MKRTRYLLPGDKVPEGAKMQNGDPMKVTMIGAYYGSSAEVEVSYSITASNAGNQLVPAYSDLEERFRNIPRKGEFAALKGESQILPQTRFGERVIEITSTEQAIAMRDDIRRFIQPTWVDRTLVYKTSKGQPMKYSQLLASLRTHDRENKSILAQKQALIKEAGYETRFIDGKKVSPEYPQDLLDKLSSLSESQTCITRYQLRLHYKVKHTIARNSAFYTGSLNQSQLDELAAKFDYKDHNSFWSGKLGRADLAIPVQSLEHIQQILDFVTAYHPIVKEWGNYTKSDIITLTRGIYAGE